MKLGRFVLLELVGSGSMGHVFSAYDPELDRKVAIKLLHADSGPSERARQMAERTLDSEAQLSEEIRTAALEDSPLDARQRRLQREAQAMARISHPNVATVYEVGRHGRDVFIAMQYIDGQTIRSWLQEKNRPWQEILAVFLQAGAGLEAAHQLGLVHRDFKPDNVMIDERGRAYVLDFGLVHHTAGPSRDGPRESPSNLAPSARNASQAVLGTPAYMSPEQFHGRAVDARSDQFSFCVSLYEAVYASRPFSGSSLVETMNAVERGARSEIPRGSQVPPWLRQAILRGLEADPAGRWPSMAALLSRLSRDPHGKRLWKAAAVLLAAGIGLTAPWLLSSGDRLPDCSRAAERLQGCWDARIRSQGRAAFLASRRAYAENAWKHAAGGIDRYAQDWVAAHTEACEATWVESRQSESLLDLRMACLDQRLAALRSLGRRLAEADAETVEQAAELVGKLPRLAICSDAGNLLSPTPLPASEEDRDEIQRVREQLAAMAVSMRRGEHDRVLGQLDALEARAREMGYQPVLAEILLAKSELLYEVHDLERAEQACWGALVAAEAGKHRYAISLAMIELVRISGRRGGKPRALALDALARARIQGTDGDEALDLMRIQYLVDALLYSLEPVEAWNALEPARNRFERHFGARSLPYARILILEGQVLYYMDQLAEAVARFDRSLAIQHAELGETHPRLIEIHAEHASMLLRRADLPGAEAASQTALSSIGSLESAAPQLRARVLAGRGEVLSFAGREAEALAAFREAAEMARRTDGLSWVQAFVDLRLAEHLFRQEKLDQAHASIGRCIDTFEKTCGRCSTDLLFPLHLLGRIELAQQRFDQAEKAFQRIVDLIESRGRDAPPVAYGLTGLGECLLARGETARAREVLERAYRLRSEAPGTFWAMPQTAFALARALVDEDRPRARRLASDARAALDRIGMAIPALESLKKRIENLLNELSR
ncbi:MAG: serine/threonine protein kinase [Deltaproteobacteria bacterium]|nr:serine/threonine protein kinase [Deltaproteobacteria bacterium]